MKVEIRSENGGYDVSVIDEHGKKIRTCWKSDRRNAYYTASVYADYYRNDNGQEADIKYIPGPQG